VDVANATFLLFSLFSSLRIVSYVPQIHRVALDGNGASAISYSTWSLWTCANIATALYAAINLHDIYLSAVSGIYAFCCVIVIALTMFKRRRLCPGYAGLEGISTADVDDRAAALEALRGVVDDAGDALLHGRRPNHMFEQDAAALARQILWLDVRSALRPRRAKIWPARQEALRPVAPVVGIAANAVTPTSPVPAKPTCSRPIARLAPGIAVLIALLTLGAAAVAESLVTKQKLPVHDEDRQSHAQRRSLARSFVGTPCGARPIPKGVKEKCGDHICWDSTDGYRYCRKISR
jgi:hypothetical protein